MLFFGVLFISCIWIMPVCGALESTVEQEHVSVKEGQTAVLLCTVKELGTRMVVWRKVGSDFPLTIGQYVYVGDVRFAVSANGPDWDLMINNVKNSDAGKYTCEKSAKTPSIVKIVTLEVTQQAALESTVEQEHISVKEGQTAVLPCSMKELGTRTVGWRKVGTDFPLTVGQFVYVADERLAVSANGPDWDLIIKSAKNSDAGKYTCEISAKTPSMVKIVTLEVTEVTQQADLNITGTKFVPQYGNINLTCKTGGGHTAPTHVDWFFNGQKIRSSNSFWNGRLSIISWQELHTRSYTSNLEISNSRMDDAGIYVCRSSDLNIGSIKVQVLRIKSTPVATTSIPAATTQLNGNSDKPNQGNTENENANDTLSSENISEEMMRATQLEFYREQILTDRKRRQMMDTEKEFYEAMIRFLQQREEEDKK
ncbi:junctional adhesion molecule B-like [Mercenaria mercenaria]|uniref:junctional adhesion molecule B-like n=1 Tax=Mercenaria mercenaria TaxID=6596 RepID=UPI00234E9FAF|nr:junctional adhesion molecule B-like [Mercenaria mercenaria]